MSGRGDQDALRLPVLSAPTAGSSLGRMLVAGVVLAAFAFRVVNLGAGSLWDDEGYTVLGPSDARWDIPSAMPVGAFSLYYHLVHAWTAVAGGSELALRFPSLGAGVALVPVAFLLGRCLGGPAAGASAAALTATSPPLIAYSQYARPYSLVVLLMALNFAAIVRLGDGARRWHWWLVAIASLIAAGYAHLFALTGLPATLLLLGWVAVRDHRQRRRLVLSVAALGGALLPWAIGSALSTYGRVAVRAAGNPLSPLEFAGVLGDALLSVGISRLIPRDPLGVALVLGLLLGWHALWRRSRRSATVALVYGLTPLVVSYGIDQSVPFFNGRYLLFLAPFVVVTMSGALAYPKKSWAAIAAIPLVAIGVNQLPLAYHQVVAAPREDLGTLAAELRARLRPGDLLISTSAWRQMNLDYYLRGDDLPAVVISPEQSPTVDEIRGAVQAAVGEHARVWVAFFGASGGDATQAIEPILSERFAKVSNNWYGTTRLALYAHAPTDSTRPQRAGVVFGEALELIEYTPPAATAVQPGDAVAVQLRWRLRRAGDYALSLRLIDPQGQVLAQNDARPRNGYLPTTTWSIGDQLVEARGLTIPWGTPPGGYDLTITGYDAQTGKGLGAKDVHGHGIAPVWVLGRVEVSPAAVAPALRLLPIPERRMADLGVLRLLGGSWPQKVSTGQSVQLDLFWQALADLQESDALEVLLLDHRGGVWGVARGYVGGQRSAKLRAGEVRLGRYGIRVSPSVPAGRYQLQVAAVPASGHGGPPDQRMTVALGSIEVESRPRRFDVPAIQHHLRATFGDQIELVGYDLVGASPVSDGALQAAVGDRVSVTLYWRAAADLAADDAERAYTVFVQMLDADGRLAAQHDGVPAGNAAPTSTWAIGEIVADQHILILPADLPPGTYTMITGLYDSKTMERLRTESTDALLLTRVLLR